MRRIIVTIAATVALLALAAPARAGVVVSGDTYDSGGAVPTLATTGSVKVTNTSDRAKVYSRTLTVTAHWYGDDNDPLVCNRTFTQSTACKVIVVATVRLSHKVRAHRSYTFDLAHSWSWYTSTTPDSLEAAWESATSATCPSFTCYYSYLSDASWAVVTVTK